jgi:hypothetical protein
MLPNAGVHSLAAPFDVLRQIDIDSEQSRHESETRSIKSGYRWRGSRGSRANEVTSAAAAARGARVVYDPVVDNAAPGR